MSIIYGWTESQWIVFAGLSVAGLSALGLAAIAIRTVRGWRAPATYRTTAYSAAPRPSLVLAQRRARYNPEPHMGALIATAYETADHEALALVIDPLALAHLQPGPGSISSILQEEGVFGPRDEDIDPDLIETFGRWAVERQRDIDTRFAPSMLKAITWAIEGAIAGVDSAAALDAWHSWHTRAETSEWPLVAA